MKITALTENTTEKENIKTEHGLSLYIETDSHKILFDFGQSDLFAQNAEAMNLDLSDADIAILSHGHYDHGGGLKKFTEINSKAPIYIHKDAFGSHYSGTEKYIGLDREFKNSDRIIFTEDETVITDEIKLMTYNTRKANYPMSNENMNLMSDGRLTTDKFSHEQYLLIRENNKTVVISGCSHKGILNISEWTNADILIGGFHFKNVEMTDKGKEKLLNTAKKLSEYRTVFYTCHCTGTEQYAYMKNIMKEKLKYLSCGEQITV